MIFVSEELAEEIASVTGSLEDERCDRCNGVNLELNGEVEFEGSFAGAGVRCIDCGDVKHVGDGDFFKYYAFGESEIESIDPK